MSATSYEFVVVLDPQLKEKDQDSLLKDIQAKLEKAGGQDVKIDFFGRREFVYPIKKQTQGNYWIFNFWANHLKMEEVNLFLNRETKILRYLLLKI